MKKTISFVLGAILFGCILCTTALAVEARWVNVTMISPSISASDQEYTSYVVGVSGTTKMTCTMVLYSKNIFGSYTEVSRTSSTYFGREHEFVGSYSIKSGTTYKLVTTVSVTANGTTETATNTFEKRC